MLRSTHPAAATGRAARLLVPVGATCFLSIFYRCLLFLPAQPSTFLPQLPGRHGPCSTVCGWGCLLVGIAMVFVGAGAFGARARCCPRWLVWASSVLFITGYTPVLASALGIGVPPVLQPVGGAVSGAGMSVLAVCWCLVVSVADFKKLLRAVSLSSLLAMGVDFIMSYLPQLVFVALLLCTLFGAVAYPVLAASEGALRLPVCEVDTDGRLEGYFIGVTSMRVLLSILGVSTLGFMLFVLLSQAQLSILPGDVLSEATFGLAGAGFVCAITVVIRTHRPILPMCTGSRCHVAQVRFCFWTLFQGRARLFSRGATLVYVFASMVGLFAMALLVKVNAQGELSAFLATGVTLVGASLAAFAGNALASWGDSVDARGAVLLSVMSAYFVLLMLAPVFRLWKLLRIDGADELAAMGQAGKSPEREEERLRVACEEVARDRGLSVRELEVLRLASQGYTSPYIAQTLVIADSTVRSHLKNIHRKLGVSSKTELIDLVRVRACNCQQDEILK